MANPKNPEDSPWGEKLRDMLMGNRKSMAQYGEAARGISMAIQQPYQTGVNRLIEQAKANDIDVNAYAQYRRLQMEQGRDYQSMQNKVRNAMSGQIQISASDIMASKNAPGAWNNAIAEERAKAQADIEQKLLVLMNRGFMPRYVPQQNPFEDPLVFPGEEFSNMTRRGLFLRVLSSMTLSFGFDQTEAQAIVDAIRELFAKTRAGQNLDPAPPRQRVINLDIE